MLPPVKTEAGRVVQTPQQPDSRFHVVPLDPQSLRLEMEKRGMGVDSSIRIAEIPVPIVGQQSPPQAQVDFIREAVPQGDLGLGAEHFLLVVVHAESFRLSL